MGLLDEAVSEIASNRGLRLTWYAVILIFGVMAVLTVVFYNSLTSSYLGQSLLNETQHLRQIASYVNVTPYLYPLLPVIIFAKNSLTDLLAYVFLVTVIIPIGIIAFNGGLVGFVTVFALPQHGNALVEFYLLAPHGVIEIPAFSLTVASISLLRRGVGDMYVKGFALLLMSLLMLVIAAIFESSVTILAGSIISALTVHTAGAA